MPLVSKDHPGQSQRMEDSYRDNVSLDKMKKKSKDEEELILAGPHARSNGSRTGGKKKKGLFWESAGKLKGGAKRLTLTTLGMVTIWAEGKRLEFIPGFCENEGQLLGDPKDMKKRRTKVRPEGRTKELEGEFALRSVGGNSEGATKKSSTRATPTGGCSQQGVKVGGRRE